MWCNICTLYLHPPSADPPATVTVSAPSSVRGDEAVVARCEAAPSLPPPQLRWVGGGAAAGHAEVTLLRAGAGEAAAAVSTLTLPPPGPAQPSLHLRCEAVHGGSVAAGDSATISVLGQYIYIYTLHSLQPPPLQCPPRPPCW